MQISIPLLVLGAVFCSKASFDLGWKDDSDLTNFVTRPEFKAPLFNVAFYEPELVTPGYWFIGPYAEIQQKPPPPKYYHPCQTGPHIYDGRGDLVWSGACQVKNQNACDFRAWNFNGTDYISAILYKYKDDQIGHAFVMDSSYKIVQTVLPPPEHPGFNMHEFHLVNDGTAALHLTFRTEFANTSGIETVPPGYGWIINMGIREVDLESDQTLFEWWAYPEVSLAESNVAVQSLGGPYPTGWNWFHGNSIAKNAQGIYLVSSRFTDTIFKVSGSNRNIVWRLGGRFSDFEMIDFDFSRQHDAQWIESETDDDTEMISLLDNGSDGVTSTSNYSSALKVRLDKKTMTARLIQRWIRPDNARSDLRGNFQHLPNGNVFAGWSDNGFISEFTSSGDLVMAAEFSSERFVTYRAYKFNFTGTPTEPPVMKAMVYGVDPESSTTVVYMSWNGATEVESWDIYRVIPGALQGDLIGNSIRSGFETRFQTRGFEAELYAEAIAVNGSVLGRTAVFPVEAPHEWEWEDDQEEDEEDQPWTHVLHSLRPPELTKSEL